MLPAPLKIRHFMWLLTLATTSLGVHAQTSTTSLTDPALIQALRQATQNTNDRSTDLDALVWLSSMSERLEKRIPNPFYRIRLLQAVQSEARAAGLDPQLVLAIIDIESNFDRHAVSRAGAQGLMQVMPFWKETYGQPDDDLHNPLVSLRYGCAILRHYMTIHTNLSDALAAYNGSLGRSVYSDKVLSRLAQDWQYRHDSYSRPFESPRVASNEPANHPLSVTPLN